MAASTPEPLSVSVCSMALSGLDAHLVEVRAELHGPDHAAEPWPAAADRQTRERVSAAIRNSGYPWPPQRLTLTLPIGPGSASTAHDLAAALAVLVAAGQLPQQTVEDAVVLGELGLDGSLRPVRGVLSALLAARKAGIGRAVVPRACEHEARLVPSLRVITADTLADAAALLTRPTTVGGELTARDDPAGAHPVDAAGHGDLADIRCPPAARRALLIAAAGGHPIQLTGPGSVMLARRLPGLLPPLTGDQALEVTAIHSLTGTLSPESPLITTAPFIAPHYSTSLAALIGGGVGIAKPGAISRAHLGVLHLEDAEEFSVRHLDAVRAALDEGEIRLARRDAVARYPTRFHLVLTRHDPTTRHRLPGMLLDRIPIRVHLPATPTADKPGPRDTTAVVRARVTEAREWAAARWASLGGTPATNATVHPEHLRRATPLPQAARARLDQLRQVGALTERGALQIAQVAWSIADLDQTAYPHRGQVDEALALRGIAPAGLENQ